MGRFSEPLAVLFAEVAGVRVLDVGCGPGALTSQLVGCLGSGAVSAIDPSASYVAAVRGRLPGVDVRHGVAERLPYADGAFDAAMAQLVVQFMAAAPAARAVSPLGHSLDGTGSRLTSRRTADHHAAGKPRERRHVSTCLQPAGRALYILRHRSEIYWL